VSLANLFCCFLSMALIFVPKVLFIRKHSHDPREKEDDERETAEQVNIQDRVVTDVVILKKFSPKNWSKKICIFGSKRR
jgi:hypothetical protein